MRRFFQEHRRLSSEELQQLGQAIDQAQPLTRDRALVEASALMAKTLVEQLRPVIAALARLDPELEKLFAQHPDHDLFASLPGAGGALAPRLAVAFGSDRDRYGSAQQIQEFAGLAPVTESSGQQRWSTGGWPVPSSCVRPSTSSPPLPPAARSGPEPTTSSSASAGPRTMARSVPWPTSGLGSSIAAGKTAPLTTSSGTSKPFNGTTRRCG